MKRASALSLLAVPGLAALTLGLTLPAFGAASAPTISGYAATNPRGVAIFSAPPGAPLLILGQNLGPSGMVAFNGIPAPPALSWSSTEIIVTVPTASSYPFKGPVTVTTNGQTASGPPFTITPPPPRIERLSPPPLDLEVPLPSDSPIISADGRCVAFASDGQIFVRDRQMGKTERVGVGESAAISASGRFVAFMSWDDNLVPGNTNDEPDVFVRDRRTETTELVSVAASGAPANGGSEHPAISADGRFVAFVSTADNLVPGDANDWPDVFVRDRQTGKTELVGVTGIDGDRGWELSSPAISADGRFVAFLSGADVFLRDRQTGKTELVSIGISGAPANGGSWESPAISADGRFVAFASWADNLVPGDANGEPDVFVRDRQTGKTERIAVGGSPAISADGRFVAFQGDGISVWDRQIGKTERVGDGFSPAISADGRFVAFVSYPANRAPDDQRNAWDRYVRDRQTGKTDLVSVTLSGAAANGNSGSAVLSADGRFIAFASGASNLVPGVASGGIFVRDRQTGKTERIAVGGSPAISADGRFVAFESWADNLAPGDTNGRGDVFVAERG